MIESSNAGCHSAMSRRQQFLQMRSQRPGILPSLLLCDFGDLRGELQRLEQAGVPALHLDVMDGDFVPNLTYGMPIVAGVRRHTRLPLDVHLMIRDPGRFVEAFYEAGADAITVHVEATEDAPAVLRQIRDCGAAAGIALNPDTPLEAIGDCLEWADLVLVMSVPAGFGGQSFREQSLEKLSALRSQSPRCLLEVDGGVNSQTIASCARAGADLFVVGSGIFRTDDYPQAVAQLRSLAVNASHEVSQ